jgi:hypothetical protein
MKGRMNAFKAIGARLLKVAYKSEGGRTVVITVIDRKR